MNESLVNHILRQLEAFVEGAFRHSDMDEDGKQERRVHQSNLALAIRETLAEFEASAEEIRFAVAILVMVYLSAMNDASKCPENAKYDVHEERMHHQVEHMAAALQDYVMAVSQFKEAEVRL